MCIHITLMNIHYTRYIQFIVCSISAYAFAELIDNSLTATSSNKGPRVIELILVSTVLFNSHSLMTDLGSIDTSHSLCIVSIWTCRRRLSHSPVSW